MRRLWLAGATDGSGVQGGARTGNLEEEKYDPTTSNTLKQKKKVSVQPKAEKQILRRGSRGHSQGTTWCARVLRGTIAGPPRQAPEIVCQYWDNKSTAKGHPKQTALLTLSRKDITPTPFGRLNSSDVLL